MTPLQQALELLRAIDDGRHGPPSCVRVERCSDPSEVDNLAYIDDGDDIVVEFEGGAKIGINLTRDGVAVDFVTLPNGETVDLRDGIHHPYQSEWWDVRGWPTDSGIAARAIAAVGRFEPINPARPTMERRANSIQGARLIYENVIDQFPEERQRAEICQFLIDMADWNEQSGFDEERCRAAELLKRKPE